MEKVVSGTKIGNHNKGGGNMGLNINKFCETLSRILSSKYDAELTVTAEKKEEG